MIQQKLGLICFYFYRLCRSVAHICYGDLHHPQKQLLYRETKSLAASHRRGG
jgi:hypothetical protein